ncbi:hypothetical protein SAMN05216419_100512 [Nitrosomonas cryotolerans]|uniref:Serine protease n=1 Tax=Nitrosomonas cryotolerans ATCC 49181 TaxID=1131553 RepID=A0A1N6G8P5_9PROT|nr:hypothetical protein [Nitrosomonas cryotolerans]SFP51248.1 hypothetical protein SAMN05216419_100512 [Nitrosomonas cryotolerans]SIO03910.1 hypothetical protein SAMN02743940_0602 [Nitrosomonas cryotolerans ATCC 49181]
MNSNESNNGENAEIGSSSSPQQGGGQFDTPPMPKDQASGSYSVFDPPTLGGGDRGGNGGDIESSAAVQRMNSVKEMIEQRLAEAASSNAMSLAGARHIDSAGVLGVGLSSGIPGQASLIVYVENEANEEQVRREIVDTMGVWAASNDDLPVEVEVTGPIEAYTTNRSKFRSAPAGVSVGHFSITAGTIGGWARGRGDRVRRLLMISNNHVLANSNNARFGDSIIQSGRVDGGVNSADRIAILERFVTIDFSANAANFIDCATGWCWPHLVRRDHVYHGGGSTPRFFKIGNTVIDPRADMVVGKTGRTTDLRKGTIRGTGVAVNVNYGTPSVPKIAHFRDQFSVRSVTSEDFSAGGDSGSFVWEWNARLSPVGLLFAGGGGTTFCNRMSRVVAALDITLLEES